MDVRAQISMVFHLDKCIGCHTCSVACKNIWTDRDGAEYMWWNNVETKPGTGYPTLWEDQSKYKGGWELKGNKLSPRIAGRLGRLANIFFNPDMPALDDYYEPWTYLYEDLFNAPQGDDQPTARPISRVTGHHIDIQSGPNWDDDLGGSPIYAANDVNLASLSDAERAALFQVERMVFFYVPRICNHCLNPACVAVCPSGALYKRGEDGIVLADQEKCRGWRFCVSGCPYKKTYYNWSTGKAEKCILCFPRLETGQAPACFHSCVGRIRYTGVLLYDADRIENAASTPQSELLEAQRNIILDPFDPTVIAGAERNGLAADWIKAAQDSPVYRMVKQWKIALPLHAEFRTMPMLFYVPSLLPVAASTQSGTYDLSGTDFFGTIENARVPVQYLAALFSAGNEETIKGVLRKLWAVRIHKRSQTVGDLDARQVAATMTEAGCSVEEAEQIFRLTALPRFKDRFVLPPQHRERDIESIEGLLKHKGQAGLGFGTPARRGP
ncbi:MAG: nitrate reductase subunit beta [Chloroflexota bacterium]|nr:MAG: nitrate reductase subunit beta [Chloroflexota bacterium]